MSEVPSIGDIVRQWREALGLSVTEFAEKAKLSKGYISEVENNKISQPKPAQLKKLAEALGISTWDLIRRQLPGEDVGEGEYSQERSSRARKSLSRPLVPVFSTAESQGRLPIGECIETLIASSDLTEQEEVLLEEMLERTVKDWVALIKELRKTSKP